MERRVRRREEEKMVEKKKKRGKGKTQRKEIRRKNYTDEKARKTKDGWKERKSTW